MCSQDLVAMDRGCAVILRIGKPLWIAGVDGTDAEKLLLAIVVVVGRWWPETPPTTNYVRIGISGCFQLKPGPSKVS